MTTPWSIALVIAGLAVLTVVLWLLTTPQAPTLRAASLLVVVALYFGGVAAIWYQLNEQWQYMVTAGVPLNLALGFIVGRWWAPLLAGLALVAALPDEPSLDGVAAWKFALLLAVPSAPVILVGVVIRAAIRPRPPTALPE